MKFIYLSCLFAVYLAVSCKIESKKDEPTEVKERTEKNDDENRRYDDEDTDITKDENESNFKIDFKQGELIATDKLKGLFPKSLGRLDRTSLEGESSGAFGFKIATVKAEYERNDKNINLELIDFGGIPGIAQVIAAWSKSDIFHEDENGYEKVTEWNGHKAFEKSDKKSNTSSIAILFKDRFLISAKGDEISIDDLKDYLEDDFMDELEDLKIK